MMGNPDRDERISDLIEQGVDPNDALDVALEDE